MFGMEAEAAKWAITQGVLGVYGVLVTAVAVYFYKASGKAADACSKKTGECATTIAEMYEKRLSEALAMLATLNKNSETIAALTKGQDTTAAINSESVKALSAAINALSHDFTTWREQQAMEHTRGQSVWGDKVRGLEEKLADAVRRLELLQAKVGAHH